MSRTIDVIVIGSGMAGLCAATAAARKNARVRIISEGMGCMAISGGAIDLLGYDNEGNLLDNPWAGLKTLAPDHPYTLLGAENIKTALDGVVEIAGRHGLRLKHAGDDQNPRNFRFPTIMGTLRPTYLYQDNIDEQTLANAERVLVVSVKGFRDCRPALVINQLRRYKGWADKEYVPLVLPSPFDEKGRTCKEIGAVTQWAKSKSGDVVFKEYRREYKRRFAWIKSGRIDSEEFYAWSEEAREKKAECEAGKISFEEFSAWLGNS